MTLLSLTGIISILGAVASLLWIGALVQVLANSRKSTRLREQPIEEPEDGWPSLAVIVAARDEEATVEASIRSLLAQSYPALEVIAVDDRSTDRTGAILDELAQHDHRLNVVHVTDIPSGWLGKTNALQHGAETAIARWLLFTDADIVFAPNTLERAVSLVELAGLDHLTATPGTILKTVGERLFMAVFSLAFLFKAPPAWVENRRIKASIGVGAFNLVRAEVFEAIGGFKRVAMSIDEDMRLGQAIKFAGYRNRLVDGNGAFAVRWQVGLGGMIRGLEKNAFASLDFRLPMVFLATVVLLMLSLGPICGLLFGFTWARAICGLGILATLVALALVTTGGRFHWLYALLLPISGPLLVFSLWRSTWFTLRRKGVTWRGHLYPLDQLRHHVELRNYWFKEVWYSTR